MAFMMAAKKGNVRIVRKLLQHGTSVNLTDKVNQAFFQIVCIRVWNEDCMQQVLSTNLLILELYVSSSYLWFPLSSSKESVLFNQLYA